MKKTAGLFLLLIVIAGSRAMALEGNTPIVQATNTPGAAATGAGALAAQVTPQKTPGLPLVYFSFGVGTALIGNGFGTEGNPWVDASFATLANGYGTSFNPSLAFTGIIGFNLDKNWSVNFSLETYSFTNGPFAASNEENIVPSVRYTFDSGPISPYVTAGYGFNFNTTSVSTPATIIDNLTIPVSGFTSQVASNMVASGGAGLLIKIAGDEGHVYLEGQVEQVLNTQGGFSYYPLFIGYQYP